MEVVKSSSENGYQNVIVMRHGDRMDNLNPLWISTAARPWDPPLIHDGITRAFRTGQSFRSQIRFPIHRVFVSPFLRCIQTASQVVDALSASHSNPNAISTSNTHSIDQFKLKVSIEFGLCEILDSGAIKPEVAPKDWKFDFSISDLEAMFPEGMVDPNAYRVYNEMPKWGESRQDYRDRYIKVLKALADKYPSENLLIVTHWGGVSSALCKFMKDARYNVDYCGYVELRRKVMEKDGSTEAMEFEVVGVDSGVFYKEHHDDLTIHQISV